LKQQTIIRNNESRTFSILVFLFSILMLIRSGIQEYFWTAMIFYVALLFSIVYTIKLNLNLFYEKSLIKWRLSQLALLFIFTLVRYWGEFILFELKLWPALQNVHPESTKILYATTVFTIQDAFFILLITYYMISRKKHILELENNRLKLENYENRMVMPNNQLSPHFLFNSLNDIYAASVTKKNETPEMILQLSEIMRFVVYETQKDEIELKEEVKQIENYIALHQSNNPSSQNIIIDLEENALNAKVLPLTLIPLLENAIKHGNTNDNEEYAFIKFTIKMDEGNLKINCKNTFRISEKSNKIAGGIGNKNYVSRLRHKYAENFHYQESIQDGIYETTINIKINEN